MIVDDDPDLRMLMRLRFEMTTHELRVAAEAGSGEDALRVWRGLHGPPDPDVVILDHHMPGMTGTDVAERMLTERPGQLIVLCSAVLTRELRARAAVIGISTCINKQEIGRLPDVVLGLTR